MTNPENTPNNTTSIGRVRINQTQFRQNLQRLVNIEAEMNNRYIASEIIENLTETNENDELMNRNNSYYLNNQALISRENVNRQPLQPVQLQRELTSAFVTQQSSTLTPSLLQRVNTPQLQRAYTTQLQRTNSTYQPSNNDLVLPTALPLFDEDDCEFTNVPQYLCCPITLCFIVDPIVCSDGYTYDRKSLENHLVSNNLSPMTREPLTFAIRNRAIRDAISNYIESHT
jgi:hypothetical protein